MSMRAIDQTVVKITSGGLSLIRRHLPTFIVTFSVFFIGSFYLILSLQPMYDSASLLLTGQDEIDPAVASKSQPFNSAIIVMRVAESDEVVRKAVEAAGLVQDGSTERGARGKTSRALRRMLVGAEHEDDEGSVIELVRKGIFGFESAAVRPVSDLDRLVADVKRRLVVRNEPNSPIVRISYRDRDPVVAARFANAVAQAAIDQYIVLNSRPGAAEFFSQQEARFSDEVKRIASDIERFSVRTGVYEVEQQRDLLLRRLSDIASQMTATRVELAEKIGQRQALAEQLRKLAPVTRSPLISSLVDALGGDRNAGPPRMGELRGIEDRTTDPPLLLVRVYQDSMVTLFRLNADLAGAQTLQDHQKNEYDRLTADLNTLSRTAESFAALQRSLSLAAYNAEANSKRAVEERVAAELRAARFTSVRFLQRAVEMARPAFPNYQLLFAAALVFSAVFGLAFAFARNMFGRRRS